MNVSIAQANDAKKKLLEMNDGIKGLPLIKSVTVVLGDEGFRLEAVANPQYKWTGPIDIFGVQIKWL